MIGYVNFDEIDSVWVSITVIILMLVLAPLMFPINFGCAVYEIHK